MKANVAQFFESSDGSINIIKIDAEALQSKLKPYVYSLRTHENGDYYLQKVEALDHGIPKRLYGSIKRRANKIISTYKSVDTSLGVISCGFKGSGKTELTRVIRAKLGIPVIQVKTPACGPKFNEFLQSVGECIVEFDEFGKVYDDNMLGKSDDGNDVADPQDLLLGVFDGTVPGKRLHIITENKEHKINSFLRNRPGRFLYYFKYDKLEDAVVRGYSKDQKLPKAVRKELLDISRSVKQFSFDMLKAICAEYLRYKEPIKDLISELNVEITTTADKLKITHVEFKSWKKAKPKLEKELIENFSVGEYFRIEFDLDRDSNDPSRGRYSDTYGIDPDAITYSDGENVIYEDRHVKVAGTIIKEKKDFTNFMAF